MSGWYTESERERERERESFRRTGFAAHAMRRELDGESGEWLGFDE